MRSLMHRINIKGDHNQVALDGDIIEVHFPIMYKTVFEEKSSYDTKNIFVKKLDDVFYEMNKYCRYSKMQLEKLPLLMNLPSPEVLYQYFRTKEEPSYAWMDQIADVLGVSRDWLKTSTGKMYDRHTFHSFCIEDFEKKVEELAPKEVIVAVSDGSRPEIMILFQMNEYCYLKYGHLFYFHGEIGMGGRSDLYRFYQILKFFHRKYFLSCNGKLVPEEMFQSIYMGKTYPGAVITCCTSYLWDDFIDLHHQYFSREEYQKMYGDHFLICQHFVLEQLNQEE